MPSCFLPVHIFITFYYSSECHQRTTKAVHWESLTKIHDDAPLHPKQSISLTFRGTKHKIRIECVFAATEIHASHLISHVYPCYMTSWRVLWPRKLLGAFPDERGPAGVLHRWRSHEQGRWFTSAHLHDQRLRILHSYILDPSHLPLICNEVL